MGEASIFAAALEKNSAEERAAYVAEACGGDEQLRRRVQTLLRAHAEPDVLLDPAEPDVHTAAYVRVTEEPGTVIGPYKLLQKIGEGGFGVVYMAEQEQPVRRRVALKVIKPGMDTAQVVARFEAERQALALMDHQHIARVLDAGTTASGRPYFVMELVRGIPLTRFCDENRLTPRERLQLFVPVCQAIQHAHQKGIIHRDIKPSNVMVTLYDGKPVAKVIDFGVAKATSQKLTERTMFTAYGQIVGTFEYMSPEQAEMSGLDIDTRSDIYSLGVLLYELLTGTTPLSRNRLRNAAFTEWLRAIKEEEPPKPSTRLSESGEALASISAQRKTEPAKLAKLMRGELDWIVMKALDKDRSRRYETANGLARDVERYLADEPVEACPPSTRYRFHKFLRKHRAGVLTAVAFLALLLAGVAGSTWQAVRATRSEVQALTDRDEKEQARQDERRARVEADKLRRKAEEGADRLKEAHGCLRRGLAHFQEGLWSSAHADFARAAELQPGLVDVYAFRMELYLRLGLWELAASDYAQVLALQESFSSSLKHNPALLLLYVGDGAGYRQACTRLLEQFDKTMNHDSTIFLVRSCAVASVPVADPADLAQRVEQVVTWVDAREWYFYVAGLAHYRAGQYEQAVRRLRQALTVDPKWNARAINYPILAMAYHRLGQADEARQALASADRAIDGWTETMVDGGADAMPIPWFDWLECRLFQREAKILLTGSPPPDDPRLRAVHERSLVAISKGDVAEFLDRGRAHARQRAWAEAAAAYGQALDLLPDKLGHELNVSRICVEMVQGPELFANLVQQRPHDARLWVAHGRCLARRREWAKATADYAKVMESRPPDYSATLEYASLLLLAGDAAGYQQFCARLEEEFGDTNDGQIAHHLARVCALSPGAVSDPARVVRWASALPNHSRLLALGPAHYRAGQFDEAMRYLRENKEANPGWPGQCMNDVFLALTHYRLGRIEEARQCLDKSHQWLDKANRELALEKVGFPRWLYPADWLIVQVLRREAQELMTAKPAEAKAP